MNLLKPVYLFGEAGFYQVFYLGARFVALSSDPLNHYLFGEANYLPRKNAIELEKRIDVL